jgi:hypothetical protein
MNTDRSTWAQRKVWFALLLGVVAIGLVLAYQQWTPAPHPATDPPRHAVESESNATLAPGQRAPRPAGAAGATAPTVAGEVSDPLQRLARERRESEARALVTELWHWNPLGDTPTAAETSEMAGYFSRLAALGDAAIPAIGEFLERMEDLDFTALDVADALGQPSLRAGLIATLSKIGGPGAEEIFLETLAVTAQPYEIGLLGKALEKEAPGVHRERIVDAARETLTLASAGETALAGERGPDVSPLFGVLRDQGDERLMAEVLSDMEKNKPPWTVYSMIALAELPDGGGISTLAKSLTNADGGLARNNVFALEMLVQASADHVEAGDALLEVVKRHGNRIPDGVWRKVGRALQGNTYGFSSAEGAAGGGQSQAKRVRIETSDLRFYLEASDPATWSSEQVEQRMLLIERILETDPPPDAVRALHRAQDWITARTSWQRRTL